MKQNELPNIKFIKGDFKRMYALLVADTLQAVYLHFPDPHMRQRFRKRRFEAVVKSLRSSAIGYNAA